MKISTPLFVLAFVILVSDLDAQYYPKVVKPVKTHATQTNLSLGLGMTRSVLYLARNVKENNDATGFNATMVYGGSNSLRGTLEYTYYRPINIEPTWYNIKASTIEANMHVLARFRNKKAYFYPTIGISYNFFSGLYTGVNDFLNLGSLYEKNQIARTTWLGVNVGTGYEYFFRPGSVFLEYKMRVGRTEGYDRINIMDVCISAGLRYNLAVRSLYSLMKDPKSRYKLNKGRK